ncbi:MAG: HPF/RaiA family ribosome-associated protein [Pirellulales bacterium]|nr:HPF/RaiA family ribosome-associated protein [Pirellulales bacterium]
MQLAISATNADLSPRSRAIVERHSRFALTRFSPAIRDVVVKLTNESGPKGAPAKKCQILVRLRQGRSIVVDATDRRIDSAASAAAERASRSVARQLERRRHNRKYQRRKVAASLD